MQIYTVLYNQPKSHKLEKALQGGGLVVTFARLLLHLGETFWVTQREIFILSYSTYTSFTLAIAIWLTMVFTTPGMVLKAAFTSLLIAFTVTWQI